MSMQIYDPTTGATGRTVAFAPRPKSLAGLLESKHGAKAHIIRKKKSAGAAPHSEIVEEFKAHCDVIVAGVGD